MDLKIDLSLIRKHWLETTRSRPNRTPNS
jgi:hypothetical protein